MVNVLKSLTEELVPKATLDMKAVEATAGNVEVPVVAPAAPALAVKAKAEIDLPDVELKLKAPLTTFT
jgi:hypothetical protein